MTEINPYFEDAHWLTKRIYLYAMCISVASHLTSILLSMSFVNALNEASRDADVIRMFGEVRKIENYYIFAYCSILFQPLLFSPRFSRRDRDSWQHINVAVLFNTV